MATIDSYIAPTDVSRLFSVMRKASRGEPIRVAGLGGSITGGATASVEGNRWLNKTANWFSDRYDADASHRLINAGVGSTESPYGALRTVRQVLEYQPDLVFVDYSVNNAPADLDSYESLLRKLLDWTPAVAVIPVQFCNAIGQGQGESLITVAQKYGLGSVSYQRDILAYLAGGGASATYSTDGVHPNDAGHALAAGDVWYFLDQVKALFDASQTVIAAPADNNFEETVFIDRDALVTAFSSGFTYDAGTIRYYSTVAASFAEYRINVGGSGKVWVNAGSSNSTALGLIGAFVDDVAQSTTNPYDAAQPTEKIETYQIATGLTPGPHRIRLITGAGTSGSNVNIYGLGWTV